MLFDNPFVFHIIVLFILLTLSYVSIIAGKVRFSKVYLTCTHLLNIIIFLNLIFLIRRFPGISVGETFFDLSFLLSVISLVVMKRTNKYNIVFLLTIISIIAIFVSQSYFEESSPFLPPPEILNNNIWIIVHVFSIIAGYTIFLIASAISHIRIGNVLIRGEEINSIKDSLSILGKLINLGTVFIIIGTVLGSIWAKIAWGRFWDWDPKETAVFIVIVTLLAGKTLDRLLNGLYLIKLYLPIIAFIMIVYTWIGVNLLQKGQHSYGFSETGLSFLLYFTLFEALFFVIHIVGKLIIIKSK